jgi:hypothetical protein
MGGYDPPPERELFVVQLLVVQVHTPPVLVIDVTVSPLGGFSVTVTRPLVGAAAAALLTVMV